MRLVIRHTTCYRYADPARRVVQALRLWPAPADPQKVGRWQVRAGGKWLRPSCTDGFGNPVAVIGLDGPVGEIAIEVSAEVETADRHGIVTGTLERLPPVYFLVESPLTLRGDGVRSLVATLPDRRGVEEAHTLMDKVRERIAFQPEETHPETTAEEALALGRGVCQDHAHAMIACARSWGVPARYVSGYLWVEGEPVSPASHAWCELYLEGLGWVGFDPANGVCPTEAYVRVAAGRDARDAAPVRGMRQGGAEEALGVSVQVIARAPQAGMEQ
ncbi:MAG: transglutaminase [Lysobacteraceae bacterium]|nr:MAG: transglutaminase [Xanthomonadaceae bacterium]